MSQLRDLLRSIRYGPRDRALRRGRSRPWPKPVPEVVYRHRITGQERWFFPHRGQWVVNQLGPNGRVTHFFRSLQNLSDWIRNAEPLGA